MTKFVNNGGEVDHYYPGGHPDSLRVATGQVVDVGDVKVVEQEDCYLVGDGDDVRAWAKSRWKLQGSSTTTQTSQSKTKTQAADEKSTAKSE